MLVTRMLDCSWGATVGETRGIVNECSPILMVLAGRSELGTLEFSLYSSLDSSLTKSNDKPGMASMDISLACWPRRVRMGPMPGVGSGMAGSAKGRLEPGEDESMGDELVARSKSRVCGEARRVVSAAPSVPRTNCALSCVAGCAAREARSPAA